MSSLFTRHSLALPQKIDSREGWFRCKIGLVCGCGKMNFYLIEPSFAPTFRLFAAECTAFWCKMECVLVQNALQYAAKCNAFCR